MVLIDELVAYVRNAGAAQDNIYTFVQALTQAARRNDGVALVVTLPESDAEAGGAGGAEALERWSACWGGSKRSGRRWRRMRRSRWCGGGSLAR